MKECQKCEETKPYSEFHKYASSKDGYQRWCKGCKGQAAIERREEKGDLLRKQTSRWKKDNRDKISIHNQTYYNKNIKKRKKYLQEYSQTVKGKEVKQKKDSKRRAIKRKAYLEDIPQSFLDLLLIKQNNQCRYCKISFDESPFPYELEHMIPYERGGFNLRGNMQLACKSCNSSKKDKTHEEYLIYRATVV